MQALETGWVQALPGVQVLVHAGAGAVGAGRFQAKILGAGAVPGASAVGPVSIPIQVLFWFLSMLSTLMFEAATFCWCSCPIYII